MAAPTTTPDAPVPPGTLFRFATAGSVDDGKSTLVGRMLHDAKAILADQLDQITRLSAQRGFADGEIDFALLTDGLRAEREQGITIDVAYRYFATPARSFILADCPGHVQYTRNMVTGAATADAVVVLVDARHGVVEQTLRHLAVVALLRVAHVVVAVNKIDLLEDPQRVVASIADEVRTTAARLGIEEVHVIPVSALRGDNVTSVSPLTPWYPGPALLPLLESLPPAQGGDGPFRLPVQLVLRPQGALGPGAEADPGAAQRVRDYRAAAGRIASGSVRVGDPVEVFPGGARTIVTGITVAGVASEEAVAPQSVAVELADPLDVARGALLTEPGALPAASESIDADVFHLDQRELRTGERVLLKHGTTIVKAIVTRVRSRYDLGLLEDVPADRLAVNDIGRITVRLGAALPVLPYAQERAAGSFLLIDPDDGATLSGGIVRSPGAGNEDAS